MHYVTFLGLLTFLKMRTVLDVFPKALGVVLEVLGKVLEVLGVFLGVLGIPSPEEGNQKVF